MSDVALYFPYVNLPSDSWVKAAALHLRQHREIQPLPERVNLDGSRDILANSPRMGPPSACHTGGVDH